MADGKATGAKAGGKRKAAAPPIKASVEDRRIDFRLVEDGKAAGPTPQAPRGKPAKRKKQKY